jgi:hypothetical protein
LCGEDCHSGQSFDHRRQWIGDRLPQLAEMFAAAPWADEEVARRWIRLFPTTEQDTDLLAAELIATPERLAVLRSRLSDLSWFMRCLSEAVARGYYSGRSLVAVRLQNVHKCASMAP